MANAVGWHPYSSGSDPRRVYHTNRGPLPYTIGMAAKKKHRNRAKKSKKPGPEAERLKVTGDPLAAFDKMVKAPSKKTVRRRTGGDES